MSTPDSSLDFESEALMFEGSWNLQELFSLDNGNDGDE